MDTFPCNQNGKFCSNGHKHLTLLLLFTSLALVAGCSRDPNVRKQKYLESGSKYFERGRYREAAIEYENAIQIDKGYADAHHQLALAYMKQAIWNGAYQELSKTVELQPANTKAELELGNLLLAGRQFKQAQFWAETALGHDADSADAHVLLANADAGLQNLEESLREMQKAIELAPDQPRSYVNLAILQLDAKDAVAAEQNFQKALSLDPKSITARLALGNFYRSQKRWPEAEKQFHDAIELAPKNPTPYAALATLLENEGKRADIEQLLIQAKQAMPEVPEGYRLLGDFYFALNDLPHARSEYASLFQQHPRDERVEKNYIQLLILSNQLDAATKLNEPFLKNHPNDAESLILSGQILNAQGHPNDAVHPLEAALKQEPQNPTAHYNLGVTLAATGDALRATSELQAAVRLRPNMVQAYRALGLLATRKGDPELLRQSADGFISAQPSLPDGYLMRAASNLVKDPAAAQADLQKAMTIAPQDSRAYAGMGEVLVSEKKYADANKLFEQALSKNPRDLQAIGGLTQLLLLQKETAQAATRVRLQIEKAPDDPSLYVLLGQVELGQKDYKAAEESLTKALELNPKNIDGMLALGAAQGSLGAASEASASYQRAIQQAPRDIRAYMLLASLEESHGQWQEAQQHYQKALEVQPDNAIAANNLAYLLLEHSGNADMALSLAQTARRGMPDKPNTADTLAWAYIHKGAYALAIDLLESAVKTEPANSTYHYHLGLAYQKNHDDAQAKAHFVRALQLNPPQAEADEIRKALSGNAGA
jgi:tetratricopeptide (TPR) repeat protein